MPSPVQLGIDFGTSYTVAVVRHADGFAEPLTFDDGAVRLTSGIHLAPDGTLTTGAAAVSAGRRDPGGRLTDPKRHVDEYAVRLGDKELPVVDAIAAVLRRIRETTEHDGLTLASVTIAHPADWGPARRSTLKDAAERAGFADPALVAEPVAAAEHLAAATKRAIPAGSSVVVVDLGAAALRVSVLRNGPSGLEVRHTADDETLGGLAATLPADDAWREPAAALAAAVLADPDSPRPVLPGGFITGGSVPIRHAAAALRDVLGAEPVGTDLAVAFGAARRIAPDRPVGAGRRWLRSVVLPVVLLLVAGLLGWWWAPESDTGRLTGNDAARAVTAPPSLRLAGEAPVERLFHRVIGGVDYLVSAAADGTIRVWSLPSGDELESFSAPASVVSAAGDGPVFLDLEVTNVLDEPAVVAATADGRIRAWYLADGTPAADFDADGKVTTLDTHLWDDEPIVVTGDADGAVRGWDLLSGEQFGDFTGLDDPVRGIVVRNFHDRPVLLAADRDRVRAWELDGGARLDGFQAKPGWGDGVENLTYVDDNGQGLVAGSKDGAVYLWGFDGGDVAEQWKVSAFPEVASLGFMPTLEGDLLAVGTGSPSPDRPGIRLYDLIDRTEVELPANAARLGREDPVTAVVLTVIDDTYVLVAAEGAEVVVCQWN